MFFSTDYYIAVPWDVTEVEKRAFKDLVKESNVKAKKVMVVDKAVASHVLPEVLLRYHVHKRQLRTSVLRVQTTLSSHSQLFCRQ